MEGTLAFVDISGFTTLTERLARKGKVGAEEVNDALDDTFRPLLSVAYDYGAGVVKWGGDAVLLLFEGDEHAPRAARAGTEMQRALRTLGRISTSSGQVTLRMSLGIHSGVFHFFLVGDLHRELLITGPGASRTVRMEAIADAGEIALSPDTAALLDPSDVGAAKGEAILLRRGPEIQSRRAPLAPESVGLDLAACVPPPIRQLLLGGLVEPEHRLVTAAFVEFRGVDALLADHGPDRAADELDELVRTVQHAAARHGVTFFESDIAHDGGKIMLIAGAPATTGRDEEGMLRAARQIMDKRCRLPIRIGINSGRVFACNFGPPYRRTYSVKGDAINTAARIMGKAELGEVLVTEATLARSPGTFDAEPRGTFALKGKAQPVAAVAIGGLLHERRRHGRSTRLVGREREMGMLLRAASAARAGSGRLVELVGEPGIGKSRLIAELAASIDDIVVLETACEQYEASTPYFPFRQLGRAALGIPSHADVRAVRQALVRRVEMEAPQLRPWLPLLGAVVGVELPDTPEVAGLEERFRRARLDEAAAELFRLLLRAPTLLLVEDTHWMDEASADLLRHLTIGLGERPWLLVTTRRDAGTGFVAPDSDEAAVLRPQPLHGNDALALIDSDTDQPLAPHVAVALAERAGGNPLFLTELVAMARSVGVDALPDAVEPLLAGQIDRLAPRDRATLRVAAVLGASFPRELLDESLDSDDYTLDPPTWERLSEFIQLDPQGTVRFRHALVRDAAYEGLPYRRRRALHARVGETIERLAGSRPEEEAALLSLHFLHAQRHDKAWRYARLAGEHARSIYANLEAAEFFGRALQAARRLQDVDPVEVALVWEALGDAQRRAGSQRDAAKAFRSSRALRKGDRIAEASLCLKEAFVLDDLGSFSQTLRLVRQGIRALADLDSPDAAAQRAQLMVFYGAVRQGQGRSREAIRWCSEGIEEAKRAGEKKALAHAYTILDWAHVSRGHLAEATHSPAALALFEELGDLDGQASVLQNLGGFAYFEGRWDDALDLYQRAQAARESLGDIVAGAEIAYNIAEILVDRGQLAEAEEIVHRSLRIWRSSGQRPGVAYALRLLGRIESRLGRSEEGIQMLFQARDEFRELGAQAEVTETDARIAGSLARQGLSEGALELATPALAGAPGPIVPLLERVVGFALAQLGDADGAREAFLRSLASARSQRAQYEQAITLDALVHLCERTDDADGEEAFREERNAIFEALGVVYVPPVPLEAAELVASQGS